MLLEKLVELNKQAGPHSSLDELPNNAVRNLDWVMLSLLLLDCVGKSKMCRCALWVLLRLD